VTTAASIDRFLRRIGESTEPPPLSPARGPPYFKSRVLRRRLGELDGGAGRQTQMFRCPLGRLTGRRQAYVVALRRARRTAFTPQSARDTASPDLYAKPPCRAAASSSCSMCDLETRTEWTSLFRLQLYRARLAVV